MKWDVEKIRSAFERNARAVKLRPYIGQKTAVTKARMREGLTCDIEDGAWRLTVGMSEKSGGDKAGPDPGVLGRGALASCLAVCYVQWAAKLGVPITDVAVEVQADYDMRGEYGVADVPAGYSEIRCIVSIESPAPEHEVLQVLDMAEAHSSYVEVFSQPQILKREVRIKESAGC